MKRHVQEPGVRKWSGDDLLELQSEGLSVLDNFFSQYGNCVICGCTVSGSSITAGLVSIGGKTLQVAAIDEVAAFPVYLVVAEEHFEREYADDVVRDIAVRYYAKAVQTQPETDDYIEITADGSETFLDKLDTASNAVTTLKTTITNALKRIVALEGKMPSYLDHEPTAADDGFAIGQEVWTVDDSGNLTFWKCHSNAEGAAVWKSDEDTGVSMETPTLDSTPTEGTLTYTLNGVTKDFSIGQQCRVYETEEEDYVFYQLYNITSENKADWRVAGSGGSPSVYLLAVNVSTNDSADCSNCMITITDDNSGEVIKTGQGAEIMTYILAGVNYTVSVSDFTGYHTPAPQSYIASGDVNNISFVYQKILVNSIVFDASLSDPANISGDVNSGYIATLLSKFRRCLAKKTAEGEIAICYLDNDNSNYYNDGTASDTTGAEGDVFVDFPEFWYKYEKIDDTQFRYYIADGNADGNYIHVPRSLVGAYKAYQSDGKLYSRSGVSQAYTSSSNLYSFDDFVDWANARGQGYQIIDYNQRCTIALMLMAKYGTRSAYDTIGVGNSAISMDWVTGRTNSALGNNDTSASYRYYPNGLGIETVDCMGCEYTQGVSIYDTTYTIEEPDGTQRTIESTVSTGIGGSIISKIGAENGPYFDIIATENTSPGSLTALDTSDIYYSSSCIYLSSANIIDNADNIDSDVNNKYLLCCSYNTGGYAGYSGGFVNSSTRTKGVIPYSTGSRLAFRGTIKEAESVEAFKALPIL